MSIARQQLLKVALKMEMDKCLTSYSVKSIGYEWKRRKLEKKNGYDWSNKVKITRSELNLDYSIILIYFLLRCKTEKQTIALLRLQIIKKYNLSNNIIDYSQHSIKSLT